MADARKNPLCVFIGSPDSRSDICLHEILTIIIIIIKNVHYYSDAIAKTLQGHFTHSYTKRVNAQKSSDGAGMT